MSARVWQCDVCDRKDFWSAKWSWFGNFDMKRNGHGDTQVEFVTCSDACRDSIPDPKTFAKRNGRAT